jgi:olfactory receptor
VENRNNATEFILLGLSENPGMQKVIFAVFFVIYIISMIRNGLIVVTITGSHLYFFLAYLSLIDAWYPSVNTLN